MLSLLPRLLFLAQTAAHPAEIRLVLKTGEEYTLAAPATHKNGRVSFKTTDGRFLSAKESDIANEAAPPPPPEKKHPSTLDTRQLGAVAREQREETGKSAAVAPPPPASKKSKTKKKTGGEPPESSSEAPPGTRDHPIPES